MMKAEEFKAHLTDDIIPFWKSLRDDGNGGYFGYVDCEHRVDKKAVKGCMLNSGITWLFANAYTLLGDESLIDEARHGFEFLKNHCWDKANGGVFGSVEYDGSPAEALKHTYNQAFAIYALSSYYEASKDRQALDMAYQLFCLIEARMCDEYGYREVFDESFHEVEKPSANGVMAQRTINTLLHVFEAYTELYRIDRSADVKVKIMQMMDVIAGIVYNKKRHRQDVFFDKKWNSLIDMYSYGHDIEASWLVDRGVDIIGEKEYADQMTPITMDLARQVYENAFDGHSLASECVKGKVNTDRVWWVQAEAVVGFLNAAEKCGRDTADGQKYMVAAQAQWEFIKAHVAEPCKCSYHSGRMCMEAIRRLGAEN